jgi:HEPN domain-containing protein
MVNKKVYSEWIEIASLDLQSAKYLQNMHPIPVEIICYHCQQSAEKYLKAYQASKQKKITKTHDLTLIYSEIIEYCIEIKLVKEDCIILTDYAVTTRYPYPLELEITDMKNAVLSAENIKRFIMKKLKNQDTI